MKRIRYIAVAALTAAMIGFGAPPASACQPDVQSGCCENHTPNVLWRDLTGNDLYVCP